MINKKSSTLKTLLKITEKYRVKMIIAVVIAFLGVAFGMVPYIAVVKVTVDILNGITDFKVLSTNVLFVLIGYTGKVIFHRISSSLSHQLAYNILKNIRKSLIQKLYNMPLGDVLNTTSGEYKAIIVDTVEKIEQPLAHIIPELISNLLVPVCMLGYMFYLDMRIALISLITIPIGLILYRLLMKRYGVYYKKYIQSKNYMNTTVVEYIKGIETIKAFNHASSSYGKYTKAVENNNQSKNQFFKKTLWFYSAVMYVMPSTLLFVLPACLYFFASGSLSIENLIACVILSFGLVTPLITAMNHTDGIASLKTTLDEITHILDKPVLKRPLKYSNLSHYQIEFKNVTFAYKEENVLEKITFKTVPQGMTAIVGASGAGKSTIGKLITNFWDVKSGVISIGDKNTKNLPLGQVNEIVSYVSQDNFLFNLSIKDNIKVGRADATYSEVVNAAKKAGCHNFIVTLNNGYNTIAGEAGDNLSGGEKQRIALARAILKDSPVVVLDEATAYIDPENENIIQKSINSLVKGKTLIVIAHKLSTIINAEQIIVMNKGAIVSKGNHLSLINSCSHYKELWHAHGDVTVNREVKDFVKNV